MKSFMQRILCVDDEPYNLSLLKAILLPRGYDVVVAADGPEALEVIRTKRVDVCLLDVMMPGMDGFEVCRLIKADDLNRNIPVVMITSYADTENRIRGIEAGAEDFISKPFDSQEVLARIKMLLHTKSLTDRLDSAYHTIAKLSAFGEQIITNFDPVTFDFMEKVDSFVHQIIRRRFTQIDHPQIVIVGMIDQADACQWVRYDPIGKDITRSCDTLRIDRTLAFSGSADTAVFFYNNADSDAAPSALVDELSSQMNPITNMVSCSTDSFCLIALNYGREVTTNDAAVLRSVVMQSLFLRSLAAQIKDTEYAENIVETVREPLIVLNSDLKIISANHRFYDTFKVTSGETIGKFIYDLGNRQWDIPRLRTLFEEILPHDTEINGYEVEHDFPGIGRKTVLLNARQIFRKNIGSHIILLAMEDITERKRLKEELQRAHDKLEVANIELEAFNYSVSHDLRGPLSVISGYCQLVKEKCSDSLDERSEGYIQIIHTCALRMNRLIDTLLDFSRITRVEMRRETFDLSSIAHEVATGLKLSAPERQITFEIAEGIRVDGDADLLQVVLENLFGNAWKYAGSQAEATIEFGVADVEGEMACFVRDNGQGFEMSSADMLFKPFKRLPGTKAEGNGIGLATVERIVSRHGGRVWAESEPGQGATFLFTLG